MTSNFSTTITYSEEKQEGGGEEEQYKICEDIGHEWEHESTRQLDDESILLVEYMCIYCGVIRQEYRLVEEEEI